MKTVAFSPFYSYNKIKQAKTAKKEILQWIKQTRSSNSATRNWNVSQAVTPYKEKIGARVDTYMHRQVLAAKRAASMGHTLTVLRAVNITA